MSSTSTDLVGSPGQTQDGASALETPGVRTRVVRITGLAAGAGMLLVRRVLLPVRRLGTWGGSGFGLGALAVLLLVTLVLPARHRIADLEALLAEPQAQTGGTPRQTAGETPRSFLAKLPGRAELPGILAIFVQQAAAANIELHDGSYEMSEGKNGAQPRYAMTLPVAGSYPDIRKFIDRSLESVPAAALDSISLQREDINSPTVKADLTFVVFLRGEP